LKIITQLFKKNLFSQWNYCLSLHILNANKYDKRRQDRDIFLERIAKTVDYFFRFGSSDTTEKDVMGIST